MTKQTYQQCQICNGQGWMYLENGEGMPIQQVACGYCGGRGNNPVALRREVTFKRWGRFHIALLLLTAVNFIPYGFDWLHLLLWVPVIAGWIVWFKNRPPKAEHAPGFTDNRERIALGVFAGALAIRWHHDQRIRREREQEQTQQDILAELRRQNQQQW